MGSEETKMKRRARIRRNFVAKNDRNRGGRHRTATDYRRKPKYLVTADASLKLEHL